MVSTMINTADFYDCLVKNGLDFFSGVPDSLLQHLCACIRERCDEKHHILAANEGNAIGIVSGYHLATGRCGVVYMQNSGIGNAVNPLVSLADEEVYRIPMLLIVGWRGEPGTKDEPQHKKQGRITFELFDALGIETVLLDEDYEAKIRFCADYMAEHRKPIAMIVSKNTFRPYPQHCPQEPYPVTRERALEMITAHIGDKAIVVSTTGKTSRELYELREKSGFGHGNDFLIVGSMGHTSSIALGISLFTDKKVYCIDGDGAFIMHMGAAAINAACMPENYRYILINNGAHESVGGQPTVGHRIHAAEILQGCGFEHVCTAVNEDEIVSGMAYLDMHPKSAMVVCVKQGSRADLGRPKLSPQENKNLLMENLQK